jgi:hypothetical protein
VTFSDQDRHRGSALLRGSPKTRHHELCEAKRGDPVRLTMLTSWDPRQALRAFLGMTIHAAKPPRY